ncbi:DUF1631 family protein [Lysobacter sp. SG-8]|uniref:DUF1631 family protein n=1 Tax=Marilutibacter penaei TaxID=2759900 RepID=A0A7W3U532_9GAMM|nr:DUF1631 family protein [Lysobacter penaei]
MPIGPQACCRALRDAAHAIALPVHARLALYKSYDDRVGPHYEAMMQVANATLDAAGILPGLEFVPVRTRAGASHPDRGRDDAGAGHEADGMLSAIEALRIVNASLDDLVPPGTLPDSGLRERGEAVAAMVRLVSRFGPQSTEWQRCRMVVAEVVDAMRTGQAIDPAIHAWIVGSLGLVGHGEAESERLAGALLHLAGVAVADAAATDAHRWQTRLEALPKGALIGFSRAGGIVRARLCDHHQGTHRVLLAVEDSGQEAWIDTDTVSHLLADGQAWLLTGTGGAR